METLRIEDSDESILFEIFQEEIKSGSRIEINEGENSLNPILRAHGYIDFSLVNPDGSLSRFLLLAGRATLPPIFDRSLRYVVKDSLRTINLQRFTGSLSQFVLYHLPLDTVPILRSSMDSEEIANVIREFCIYLRENGILYFQPLNPKYLVLSEGEVLFVPGRMELFMVANNREDVWSARFCDPESSSWRGGIK